MLVEYAHLIGKISSGKSDEILVKWQIFLPDEYFYPTNIIIKESKFPGKRDKIYLFFSHECSIQRPNFKVGVILVQHQ